MSQRREIEGRLALYDDLAGILGAMRSFALAELHRVTRRAAAQHEVVTALHAAWCDLAPALAEPAAANGKNGSNGTAAGTPSSPRDLWLLLGSVRGFCGSFNEDVARAWRDNAPADCRVIVVGERLISAIGDGAQRTDVAGVIGGLDAAAGVDRILAAIDAARTDSPNHNGLMLCYRDETETRCERLLPLPQPPSGSAGILPLTHEAPAYVAGQVAEHYLFHTLLARLLQSIRVENHMRLMQMENALQHLERGGEALQRQRNRLRQEEIIEEIELIVRERDTV